MNTWIIIGYLATLTGAISLIPEVIKAYHTHHLQDISWGMLSLLISSSVFWGAYGYHLHDSPLIISAIMNFMAEFTLIAMKKHYDVTGKPLVEHFKKKKTFTKQLQPAMENETIETENGTL